MRYLALALTTVALASTPAAAGDPSQCTPKSGCPENYAAVYSFMSSFCADKLSEDELADVERLVSEGAIDKGGLEALLNVYGAMYGYEFKMLKQLNAFFYDKNASKWLPDECVPKIKSKDAKKMPFELTKQRDHLRRLYDAHFKGKAP
ncbi:MAG: hypothetical protein IT377_08750 [Polyangiaceae bacterium]|nr:hypothetical protein [Polyangiaceae bacterium]